MKISHFFGAACLSCASLAAVISVANSARADTLIVQRGDSLYVEDLTGATPERKILTIGNAAGAMWAASPDGRRIAWVMRAASAAVAPSDPASSSAAAPGLTARPAVAYVSDLSGKHEKRLFDTSFLRDRQAHKVVSVDAGVGGVLSDSGAGKLDDWEPASLSWSADGRTLYLSCISQGANGGGKATFATDGASGYALVDADERWRSLAAVTSLDAHSGVLAGSGIAQFTVSSEPGTPQRYTPVVVVDLAAGTRTPLYAASGNSKELPDCAFATDCALSPDTRMIAFIGASKGLWLVDRKSRVYRRLVDGAILRPRWSRDGKQILFLLPRPVQTGGSVDAPPIYDLYAVIPAPLAAVAPVNSVATVEAGTESLTLRLIMQNVDGFAVTPD